MRRLAVLVAIVGAAFPSWAQADPFEHLATRLEHYDKEVKRAQYSRTSAPPPEAAENVPTPIPEDEGMIGGGEPTWEEPFGEYGGYDDGTCDSCNGCGGCGKSSLGLGGCRAGGYYWGRAEYLVWWVRGASTPPLVTTSPDGTPPGAAGVLPNATILFGNERINTAARSGGRFTIGKFFDPCQELGIEDTFFFVGNSNDGYFNSSSGSPILARPFFSTQTNAQESLVIAYPQINIGSIGVTSNRSLFGNELNLRRALYNDCCHRVDILAGYRYFHLGEGLSIDTHTTALDSTPANTQFAAQDLFGTSNNFNGGNLGLDLQYFRGCWTFDFLFKVAIGGVSQRVNISGQTVVTAPNEQPVTNNGGLLALPSNIGTFRQTDFGILPELGVNLRYQWSPLWTLSMGYTFIGLTNVVRPGDQIDLRVDPRQIPPPSATGTFPQFAFHTSDLWVQGLSFGIECDF